MRPLFLKTTPKSRIEILRSGHSNISWGENIVYAFKIIYYNVVSGGMNPATKDDDQEDDISVEEIKFDFVIVDAKSANG